METSGEAILETIQACAAKGMIRCSNHGYDELAADRLYFDEVVKGLSGAEIIEAYPEYPKGPSLLALQADNAGKLIHVVWGIPKGHDCPAVLVTAYRPDPEIWDSTFRRRKQ